MLWIPVFYLTQPQIDGWSTVVLEASLQSFHCVVFGEGGPKPLGGVTCFDSWCGARRGAYCLFFGGGGQGVQSLWEGRTYREINFALPFWLLVVT